MSLRKDLKSLFYELSSIVAGFKLALIAISYFGLGSVAKWVISYWYPFTRRIWDEVCRYVSIPELPNVVKDSLTALVFFLPLGITALLRFRKGPDDEVQVTHRLLGAFFGIVFLVLICKDVFRSILEAFSGTSPFFDSGPLDVLLTNIRSIAEYIDAIPREFLFASFLIYAVLSLGALGFIRSKMDPSRFRRTLLLATRKTYKILAFLLALLTINFTFLASSAMFQSSSEQGWAILLAVALMFLIMTLMAVAVAQVPKKLLVTTGAALAFVLASVAFETVVTIIGWIETVAQS